MINVDTITTYQYLINFPSIFKRILKEKHLSLSFKQGNLFPEKRYQIILEEEIEEMKDNDKSKFFDILSVKNLIEKGILLRSPDFEDLKVVAISQHILDIFKNIEKEYDNPLTKTEYENYHLIMRTYTAFFKENISSDLTDIETKEIFSEKFQSLFSELERIKGNLIRSVSLLKYKKNNLGSLISGNNVEKYLFAKELDKKYIEPLYTFTNDKRSKFMQELTDLMQLFEESGVFFNEKYNLNFFLTQILLLVREISPIRTYILGFLREEERAIKRNLGSEKLFNELNDFLNERSTDALNRKYLFSCGAADEINGLNKFFKESGKQNKDENVMDKPITKELLDYYYQYINEELFHIEKKSNSSVFINSNYEEDMKNKEEIEKRQYFYNTVLDFLYRDLNQAIIKDEVNIVDFCVWFLNYNYKDNWNIGNLSYILSFIYKTIDYKDLKNKEAEAYNCIDKSYIDNISLYSTYEKKYVEKEDKRLVYQDTFIKLNLKDEK